MSRPLSPAHMFLAHLRRPIPPSSDKLSGFALFSSTKCEKAPQNVAGVRTASEPAGSDHLGSLGDAAGGCAAGDVCHLRFTCTSLSSVLCLTSVSSVGGAAPRPSDGVTSQEVAPLSAQRRRELEHYLHLKRSEVIFLLSAGGCLKANPCLPAGGGYRTGAAGGPKTRTWSLTRTRRSRLLFLLQQPMRAKPEIS